MKILNKKLNTKSGFTLIEIMVAVSIFALVMVIAVGAILAVVGADKKAQALNSVITNLNFALEGMTRDLRTGYDYDCDASTPALDNCNGTDSSAADSIIFTSAQSGGNKVIYSLTGDAIFKKIGDAEAYPLTAPEVTIDKLNFYVTGTGNGSNGGQDYRQPKILIVIHGKYGGFGQEFNLQTLVSQRKLDI